MARKKSSSRGRSCPPLLTAFRMITSPIARFCTVSTDTLDKFVELCAGPNAIIRIERSRSTKLINKLSRALDPEHVGEGTWADAVGGRFTGVREAKPSLVTPWKDPHFGVVYRYRMDESPDPPIYRPPPGSGSLYGLMFNSPSSSRRSNSPELKSKPNSPNSQSCNFNIDRIIEKHSRGRTNLANRYQSYSEQLYPGRPSSPAMFIPDKKESEIAATVAVARGVLQENRDNTSGELPDETNVVDIRSEATKIRSLALSKTARPGRVRFRGVKEKEKGTVGSSKNTKRLATGLARCTNQANEVKKVKKVQGE